MAGQAIGRPQAVPGQAACTSGRQRRCGSRPGRRQRVARDGLDQPVDGDALRIGAEQAEAVQRADRGVALAGSRSGSGKGFRLAPSSSAGWPPAPGRPEARGAGGGAQRHSAASIEAADVATLCG